MLYSIICTLTTHYRYNNSCRHSALKVRCIIYYHVGEKHSHSSYSHRILCDPVCLIIMLGSVRNKCINLEVAKTCFNKP